MLSSVEKPKDLRCTRCGEKKDIQAIGMVVTVSEGRKQRFKCQECGTSFYFTPRKKRRPKAKVEPPRAQAKKKAEPVAKKKVDKQVDKQERSLREAVEQRIEEAVTAITSLAPSEAGE